MEPGPVFTDSICHTYRDRFSCRYRQIQLNESHEEGTSRKFNLCRKLVTGDVTGNTNESKACGGVRNYNASDTRTLA